MSDDPVAESSCFGTPTASSLRRPVKALPSTRRGRPSSLPLLTRRIAVGKLGSVPRQPASTTPPTTPHRTTLMREEAQRKNTTSIPQLKTPAKPKRTHRYIRDVMARHRCILLGETIDSEGLIDNKPKYTILSPETLLDGMCEVANRYHAWVAVKGAMETPGSTETRVQLAMDLTLVELGVSGLERCPGCHFTFVDPRLAEDEAAITKKVFSLSHKFEERGIARSSIVFNIPATLSGIRAAQTISRETPIANRIKTNLILVQGLTHAAACTEAAPFAVTLAVGPVLRWHEGLGASSSPFPSLHPSDHPGMAKLHTIEEVEELLAFSGIQLSLPLMNELRWATTHVSDSDLETVATGSKAHRIAEAAAFPSEILIDVETQTEERPPFLPTMSHRTHTMAGHNIRNALNAMEDKIKEFEEYLREEIKKWEERAKPCIWEVLVSGASTIPNSPEKPWDINRDGSLDLTDRKITLTRGKSSRVLNR